jgi:hypothetical protein
MYNANELRIVQNLQNNIECELNRIGLLYRFFSRTKSESSITKNSLKNQINIQNTGKRFKIYLASELFCIFLMIY